MNKSKAELYLKEVFMIRREANIKHQIAIAVYNANQSNSYKTEEILKSIIEEQKGEEK